jgi:CheY-like chemotaxis protein
MPTSRRAFLSIASWVPLGLAAAAELPRRPPATRLRARELGVRIGRLTPGPGNAITDVAGVEVGQVTRISGSGPLVVGRGPARTGVTAIWPHRGIHEELLPCAAAVPNGNGETILLVDDEEPLVRLGEEMIAQLGYEPVGFTSSVAALATFRAEPQRFNAVLSDEAMPEMTGSELIQEIRRIRPDIPIVLMSGYVTTALSARARDAGVAEVLSKPLVSRDIARSLSSALQR